ncbi:hypothetical protein U1Q18_047975, partial [Sarracenia purpurea var. burkii]
VVSLAFLVSFGLSAACVASCLYCRALSVVVRTLGFVQAWVLALRALLCCCALLGAVFVLGVGCAWC